jgi:uncharacterized protein (TIGR00290 family)
VAQPHGSDGRTANCRGLRARVRVALSWSSGKDSAWALHLLQQDPNIEVVALVTTLKEQFDRVAMHAVRRELLEMQAAAIWYPLWTVPLPWPCSNEEYEARMRELCARAVTEGIEAMAFGDLFLPDIRGYKGAATRRHMAEPIFRVWGIPTAELARTMIGSGIQAKITWSTQKTLSPTFAGRDFDHAFFEDLPATVDPCGENDEFHTFVYEGPIFVQPLAVEVVQIIERDGFVNSDRRRRTSASGTDIA